MSQHKTIRIIITDDHPMVIDGLIKILAPYDHIQVINTFTSGQGLLEGLNKDTPDVLLLDLQLPDYIGEDLVPIILKKNPHIRILAVTSVDTISRVKHIMRIGCSGYVLKNISADELAEAIFTLKEGSSYLSEELKTQLLQNVFQQDREIKHKSLILTRREKEVLQLIAKEYSTKEIAEALHISPFTVENHRKNLFQKLDVKNVAGLIRKGMILGLVE